MIDAREKLRRWLAGHLAAAPRGTKGELAEFLGVRPDAITRMVNSEPGKETRDIKANELALIAEFFKDEPPVSATQFTPARPMIPLKRYVGAGHAVYPIDDGSGDDDYIEAPPGMNGDAIAAVIRGNSMYPRYDDGNIIMWSRYLPPIELLNREAVIGLADGRILVKTITRGSTQNLWTLISFNDQPIIDQVLEWAAPIDWVKRR